MLTEAGLAGGNGTYFAPSPGAGEPQLPTCTEIPLDQWTNFAPAGELGAGRSYCVITDEERYGYFTIRRVEPRGARVERVSFNFVVWKGLED